MVFRLIEDKIRGRYGRISGRLDASAAPDIRADVAAAFLGEGRNLIVLDLSEVSFLDSIGLGALIGLSKAARGLGGGLRVTAASPPVRRMLQLTDLETVFGV
jgi:anti-sigma B factor antagonist